MDEHADRALGGNRRHLLGVDRVIVAGMLRLARAEDWEDIASWRAAHFANMARRYKKPRPVINQRGLTDATWLVLEKGGAAAAALSYTEDPGARIRYAWDIYAAPGHATAGLILGEYFEQMCDAQGYEIHGQTDPENVDYLRVQLKRGYEITAVHFKRVPKAPAEAGEQVAST